MDPASSCTHGCRVTFGEAPSELDQDLEYYLEWGQKNLSTNEYILFAASLRKRAQELKKGAGLINHLNQVPLDIASDVQLARSKLYTAGEIFSGGKLPNAQTRARVEETRSQIDSDIDQLDTQLASTCLQQDPLWAYKREKIMQNMAVAQMGAFVVEKVGEGVQWVMHTALGEENCKVIAETAKKAGKEALDSVGLKEPVKSAMQALASPPVSLRNELERQFGIPHEQADAYHRNTITATLGLMPVPPVLRLLRGASVAKTGATTAGFKTVADFTSQSAVYSIGLKNGKKPAIHIPYVHEGDSLTCLVTRIFDCERLKEIIGTRKLLQLNPNKHLDFIVDEVKELGIGFGVKRIAIVFDEAALSLTSKLNSRNENVLGVKSLASDKKPWTVVEIGLTPARVELERVSWFYPPSATSHSIDKAVTGIKSTNMYSALGEIGASHLLPFYPMQTTRQDLWRRAMTHAVFTRDTAFNSIKYTPDSSLVMKLTNRGRDCIVKEFHSGLHAVNDLQGLSFLTGLQLKAISLPSPVAAGRYLDAGVERYFVTKTYIPGITLRDAFSHVGSLSHVDRSPLHFDRVIANWGKALGELQSRGLQRNRTSPLGFIDELHQLVEQSQGRLKGFGLDLDSYKGVLKEIASDFKKAPGKSSFGFGDSRHPEHFLWVEDTSSIALINTAGVTKTIGVAKQGMEPVARQYNQMLSSIAQEGLTKGLSLQEVTNLQHAFTSGFNSQGQVIRDASSRFFEVHHSLETLAHLAEHVEAKNKFVEKETLNVLIDQFKAKL